MKIDVTTIFFNSSIDGGTATAPWCVSIGQGKEKKINQDIYGLNEVLDGLIYTSVRDRDCVDTSSGSKNNEYLLVSKFDKVYVNGDILPNAKLIVLLVREHTKSHEGRLRISVPPYASFKNDDISFSNESTYQVISEYLGCGKIDGTGGCWFVNDISVENQDEIHLSCIVVNKHKPMVYSTSQSRSVEWQTKTGSSIGAISNYDKEISPIILYGPPGTGKTFSLQNDYINKFDEGLGEFTTFHQSFSYEEFVEGLKPILNEYSNEDNKDVKYTIEKGVFYRVCEKAAKIAGFHSLSTCLKTDKEERETKFNQAVLDKKLVILCIDEINRGNVASIFGDLISLIEPSKRLGAEHELTLTLPYSKTPFGVPPNLVIVGTMNTADRSIQLLDTALRRRFRFQECPPKYDIIPNETARKVLKSINARIRAIFNKDNQIGHSYFMDATTNVQILKAICEKVVPLLEEYFYNNTDKIRFILNDIGNSPVHFYVEDIEAKKAAERYSDVDIDTEEVDFYEFDQKIYELVKQNNEQESEKYLNLIIGE